MPRTLEERLAGADPEPWIPEEGDSVFGEIEEISTREGDWGEYKVVTIVTEQGDVLNVACWDTVCGKKLEELDPSEGDMIGFKFLGEKLPKGGGKAYKNWRLVLARAERAPVTTPVTPAFDDDDE